MHGGATGRCLDGKSAARAWGDVGLATTATAVDRSANGRAQPPDRAGHEVTSRCCDPTGGSTWFGSGFGAANNRGGGRSGQYVPFGRGVDLLGGNLSRQGGKRGA